MRNLNEAYERVFPDERRPERPADASGTNVAVFVERRGRWHVVARTTVPGDEPVGAITWTPTSDAVVVAVGSNLVVLALASDGDNRGEVHSSDARANPLSNLGALAASACAALPEYHPDALVDWLVRGKTRRARRAARRATTSCRAPIRR